MKVRDVAIVLEETVGRHNQFDSLMWHYGGILQDDPLDSLHEDWGDCWDVAYNQQLDWKSIVELTIYWLLEERVRLGAYET